MQNRPPAPPMAYGPVAMFRRYLGTRWTTVVVLGMLLVVSTVLAVLLPQILRMFIDLVQRGTTAGSLATMAVSYLAVAAFAELLWIGTEFLGARVAWAATNELREDLAAHCLGQDLEFYERHSPGELIDRVDGDVGRLAQFFSDVFLLILSSVLLLVGIGVALAFQDWRIALCYLPLVAGGALLLRRLVGKAIPAAAAERAEHAGLMGYLEERLVAMEDIAGAGARHHVLCGFWLKSSGLLTASRRAGRLAVRWPAAAQSLTALGLVLALAAGAAMVAAGTMTVGAAYALVAYAGLLQMPLMVLVMQFHQLEGALGALRRIGELFGERAAVVDGPGELRVAEHGRGLAVEFDKVDFSYRQGEYALRGISLRIEPGRRLAVVGRTGSGKSTLARLVFRFADPTSGRILLDGQDIRGVTVPSVRRRVGMVTQEVQLFHASVRDNVTGFDDGVPGDVVDRAIREVGMGEWLDGLADGIATQLDAGAVSAGQAQLLAFARLLIQDPDLIVLDEVSSRLDPASRRLLETAAERLLVGRTVVIVTHQLDAIRSVDEVLVLGDGRVVEHGRRTELAADPDSQFGRMVRDEVVIG